MVKRQVKHIRKSKKGKKFVAGKRKRTFEVKPAEARAVIKANSAMIQQELRVTGRARIPDIGILKVKRVPARKGGKKIMMFGKETIQKARPASKKIKFTASKALKEAIGA
jgi:nucleoid DNA-binding protein